MNEGYYISLHNSISLILDSPRFPLLTQMPGRPHWLERKYNLNQRSTSQFSDQDWLERYFRTMIMAKHQPWP